MSASGPAVTHKLSKGALENVDLAKIMYASPVKNFPHASLGIATTCIKVNDQQN